MEVISKFFEGLTEKQTQQIQQLEALYKDWNSKINVISRKDIDHLYTHHVLHSLAIHAFIQFKPGSKIIDVGTGGGFPGIPLAILQPECEFTLVDSIGKKTKVAQSVADEIGLENVQIMQKRAEKVKNKYDFVVSRAVTNLPKFVSFTRKLISKEEKNAIPNGIIYLKGGEIQSEIDELNAHTDMISIQEFFDLEYFDKKFIVYICL